MIQALGRVSRDDVASAWRLWRGLPALLRPTLSVAEARTVLRARLERREARFLAFAGRAIYARPDSPYRALLSAAGCEAGDLEELVRADGLDAGLKRLYRAGVYLTIDELKGRVPAVRGSTVVHVDPERLYNPLVSASLAVRSGGTRGRETMVPVGLDSMRDVAVNQCLSLDARGGLDWPMGVYGIPGGSATRVIVRHAVFGRPPVRWFSQVDPSATELHPRYRWSARIMRWSSLRAGVPIPRPRYVPVDDPEPIVAWMAEVLGQGRTPHLRAFASSAVTICRAASAMGVSLAGAEFTVTGEPFTPARRAVLDAAGTRGVPNYATMEAGGPLGSGCLNPREADEHHLYGDTHAVVPAGEGGPLPARALLLTVLFPTSPLVLLNASAGDQAEFVDRPCGCALEALGWTARVHTIRSFEKLTAGGMTFLDRDVIRVLEDVLPARFGGGPNDYQLVESEDEGGAPRLNLLVSPSLGPLSEDAIRLAFLTAIGDGGDAARVMSLDWARASRVRVERRPPQTTVQGKIYHLLPKKVESEHGQR